MPIEHPLSARVAGLARAYDSLPAKLGPTEWWFDSRDFLYLCKQLAFAVKKAKRSEGDFDVVDLLAALRRNFQTLKPECFKTLVEHFFFHVGFNRIHSEVLCVISFNINACIRHS
jgi:hypothetical protein